MQYERSINFTGLLFLVFARFSFVTNTNIFLSIHLTLNKLDTVKANSKRTSQMYKNMYKKIVRKIVRKTYRWFVFSTTHRNSYIAYTYSGNIQWHYLLLFSFTFSSVSCKWNNNIWFKFIDPTKKFADFSWSGLLFNKQYRGQFSE